MVEYEVYKIKNMTFYLSASKTIMTTQHQTFALVPVRHIYNNRLERIREKIRSGKIESQAELVTLCGYGPGKRDQMVGIEMISTKLERYL